MESSRDCLSNESVEVSLLLPFSGAFHDLFLFLGRGIESSGLTAMLRNTRQLE